MFLDHRSVRMQNFTKFDSFIPSSRSIHIAGALIFAESCKIKVNYIPFLFTFLILGKLIENIAKYGSSTINYVLL